MARKKQLSKELVLAAAVEVLKERGEDGINARAIAAKMHCSTQPIYSSFGSMEELKFELEREAERRYSEYAKKDVGGERSGYFKYGKNFLTFAKDDSAMFKYLYLRRRKDADFRVDDVNLEDILDGMQAIYGMPREQAEKFHRSMAIFVYGIGVMIATGYGSFDDDKLAELLNTQFWGLLNVMFPDKAKQLLEQEK